MMLALSVALIPRYAIVIECAAHHILFGADGASSLIVRNPGQSGSQEDIVAKGQLRSNREIRKPKKKKPVAAPVASLKGISASIGLQKKKG